MDCIEILRCQSVHTTEVRRKGGVATENRKSRFRRPEMRPNKLKRIGVNDAAVFLFAVLTVPAACCSLECRGTSVLARENKTKNKNNWTATAGIRMGERGGIEIRNKKITKKAG